MTYHLRRIPLFLILGALIFIPSCCFAITMDVEAGFGGTTKGLKWTPVTVKLTNSGSDDIDGVLSVALNQEKAQVPVCSTHVVLPANSKKLYHTYIKLNNYAGDISVALLADNRVQTVKKVSVDCGSSGSKLVVAIGNRAERPSFLTGEKVHITPRKDRYGSTGPSEASIYVGSMTKAMLPDRPSAYGAVDVLLASELSSINPKVLNAIRMWVASGGTLVVSSGADYKNLKNEFYDDVLSVKVTGATSVAAFGSSEPLAVTAVSLKPGIARVISSANGVPLVIERDYGAGRVVFLAFDRMSPQFTSWSGQIAFWKKIIASDNRSPLVECLGDLEENGFASRYNNYSPDEGLAGAVAQNPSIKAPSFNIVGLFLLVYIVMLVPVNYAVLKKRNKLEFAWISTPVIALFFTLSAYAIGYTMMGGRLHMNQVSFIETSSGCRFGRMVTETSVFSPSRRSYDISVADPLALSMAITGDEREIPPEVCLDEQTTISNVGMAMWSSRLFESTSGVDLGGQIEANLVLEGQQLRGEIRNNTGIDLTDCRIAFGDSTADIGNLPRGSSAKVDMQRGRVQTNSNSYYPNNMKLDARVDEFAHICAAGCDAPMLIARSQAEETYSIAGQKYDSESTRRYLVRLNYSQ